MKSTLSLSIFKQFNSAAALALAIVFGAPALHAKPVPDNLGYGLDKLVESNLALSSSRNATPPLYNGFTTEAAANYDALAIKAEDGRYMVDITLDGKVGVDELQKTLAKNASSFEVTSVDPTYRGIGIIEGWVAVEDALTLAKAPGVRAVFLALKPNLDARKNGPSNETKVDPNPPAPNFAILGTKFLQGVTQHRVDKINQFYNPSAPVNYDGEGITVGVLSDSFASNAAAATTNVNNWDLPGAANNPVNTQPVVVLQDLPGSTDEGRGMCEIVYKLAPKAKIGFATAFIGEVGFANNIRALSGRFPGVPNTQPGFLADVITDDVSYGGEPVFADGGVVANGVDDVAAVGVSYFASAGNSFGVSAYNSDLRMVPNGVGVTAATNTALAGTNIDLTGVPTNLYQGGFHNFNPNGQDVACLWNISSVTACEMQWDDPYDSSPPTLNQPPIYSNTGVGGPTPVVFNDIPTLSVGQKYVISETATSGNFDGIVSITDSMGVVLVDQDSGTDEVVTFFPPATGTYTVTVRRFGTTSGNFNLVVNTATGSPLLTTDLNLLIFRLDTGFYVGTTGLTSNNLASNRPVELGSLIRPAGVTQVQFVIARSSTPTAPRPATRVRCSTARNGSAVDAPAEYFDYNSAVTGRHAIAAGCNGVAAYDVFKPNVPQDFTSGGPALIFFDRNQNLYPTPEVRLQPRLAAANGSNSTWGGAQGDSGNDVDTGGGQFYGTSAAAPHAAGIAALVLDAKGGPGSVTPTQMRTILQNSTFPHDLDPYMATGVARTSNGGKVTVTIRSDNTAIQSRGRNDPNSTSIAYVGPGAISSFVFNPNGLASEGGGVTSGQNGVDINNNYFSNITPGMYFTTATATGAFAFTVGASTGLIAADVTPVLSNQAPAPVTVTPNQGQTLTLNFAAGTFVGGDILRFTIGRGLIRGPNVTLAAGASLANYNADLIGSGVLIPEGTVTADGMRFSGTLEGGATFDGRIRNRLGFGFSQLDGFGFINAEQAVSAPLP